MACGAVRWGPWPGWATRQRVIAGRRRWCEPTPGVACRIVSSLAPASSAGGARGRRHHGPVGSPLAARACRRSRAASSVNLDQWATLDARLAERQPQRQQHALSRRRDRPVPARGRRPERRRPHDPDPVRLHRRGAQGVRLPGPLHGWVSPPICGVGWRRDLVDVPVAAGPHSSAFPSDGFTTDGLSVREAEAYSGRIAPDDDLGRRRSRRSPARSHAGSTVRQQHRRVHRPLPFDRVRGGPGLGRPPRPVAVLEPGGRWSARRRRRGVGAPWHMRTLQLDGSGNRNQDRSIQPSAIVGELPPRALAPPTPTPRPTPAPRHGRPAAAARADARPADAGQHRDRRAPIPTGPPTSTSTPASASGRATVRNPRMALILLSIGWFVSLVADEVAIGESPACPTDDRRPRRIAAPAAAIPPLASVVRRRRLGIRLR